MAHTCYASYSGKTNRKIEFQARAGHKSKTLYEK
jgi:hypothetical protein